MKEKIEKLKERYRFDETLARLIEPKLISQARLLNPNLRYRAAVSIAKVVNLEVNPRIIEVILTSDDLLIRSDRGRLQNQILLRGPEIHGRMSKIVGHTIGFQNKADVRRRTLAALTAMEEVIDQIDWRRRL